MDICEASGYKIIKSEAECREAVPAIQALGPPVEAKGKTSNSFYSSGCYLHPHGSLWYNTKHHPKHCNMWMKCVCINP